MKFQLRRCTECKRYTLKEKCPACSGDTASAHPAKFSPDDKYMRYRLAERYAQGAGT
ncbi:MAG: RNA-protein complex protein Nop10 [Nitrosopumilus sp. H8]|nr:MAG: RNA-protein complex protein Nop10 [Nitrosopumilus sp. H8]